MMLNQLLINYVKDPQCAEHNFALAEHYYSISHTAAAMSYYVRTAERTSDEVLQYTCLIKASEVFHTQGSRALSMTGLLKRAIALLPQRPEAYYQLARYHYLTGVQHANTNDSVNHWFTGYMLACVALDVCDFDVPPLPSTVDYGGRSGVLFYQAGCAWWSGLCDQARSVLAELYRNPSTDHGYRQAAADLLQQLGVDVHSLPAESPLKHARLAEYQRNNFTRISGYNDPRIIRVLDLIAGSGLASSGGVCEIGVHHGQFYMMMNCLTEPHEQSYAIDVFDNQQLNVDNSGRGSLSLFKQNLSELDPHGGINTNIICGDSTDSALGLVDAIGAGTMRMVSVDGGHTAEHAVNDLQLAQQLVTLDGVVLLDDILHHCWLGVLHGALSYLETNPALVPFAVGFNKLWLCRPAYHPQYLRLFDRSEFSYHQTQTFAGHQVATI